MNDDYLNGIRILIGDLERDLRALGALVAENERARERIGSGARDSLDFAALGYTIHNIYGLMENCFFRIAKTFENHVEGEAWHRDLVRRMSIEVEGIRPSVLDEEVASGVDELRAFRHVFRNVYQSSLNPRKVLELQEGLPATIRGFTMNIGDFVVKLRRMVEEEG